MASLRISNVRFAMVTPLAALLVAACGGFSGPVTGDGLAELDAVVTEFLDAERVPGASLAIAVDGAS